MGVCAACCSPWTSSSASHKSQIGEDPGFHVAVSKRRVWTRNLKWATLRMPSRGRSRISKSTSSNQAGFAKSYYGAGWSKANLEKIRVGAGGAGGKKTTLEVTNSAHSCLLTFLLVAFFLTMIANPIIASPSELRSHLQPALSSR